MHFYFTQKPSPKLCTYLCSFWLVNSGAGYDIQHFNNLASRSYKQEQKRLHDEETIKAIRRAIKTDGFGLDERQLACKLRKPISVINRLLVKMEITKHGGKLHLG